MPCGDAIEETLLFDDGGWKGRSALVDKGEG